ncbi:MAG: SIS domain-containing protein [bacterium]|nr:SIS domain-containing protein [bacterium]
MCGLTGIVTFKNSKEDVGVYETQDLYRLIERCKGFNLRYIISNSLEIDYYLGGEENIKHLADFILKLKRFQEFQRIFYNEGERKELNRIYKELNSFIKKEEKGIESEGIKFKTLELEEINKRLTVLLDVSWAIEKEILENIEKIKYLANVDNPNDLSRHALHEFKKLNFILNELDRLEIRGRDSSGISTIVTFPSNKDLKDFQNRLRSKGLEEEFRRRQKIKDLLNGTIYVKDRTVAFTFKTAAVIGRLGDNVNRLKESIKKDRIFQSALREHLDSCTTIAHTRWASCGIISEENCHPVDNLRKGLGNIFVVLNGDIDNYSELRSSYEEQYERIGDRITTDTKIIPLQVEKYLLEGKDIEEAFRLAVNSFTGSHAICMQSDIIPGKIFLALRGSGQAIYIGLSEDAYIPASEIYGFVEETPYFLKMEGEKERVSGDPKTKGQIYILDQTSSGKLDGIKAFWYDGVEIRLTEKDIRRAEITTRDIDRRDFLHFFIKEITESPRSVLKTFRGKVGIIKENGRRKPVFSLGEEIIPKRLEHALRSRKIKHIFFIGQGTAGVAAQGIADLLNDYIGGKISVYAKKASELSGFHLKDSLSDTLVIAVTQSGTTTDTNKAIDLAKEKGAYTMAIVNRRGSDITYKVDGVFYTSDGRDIEMSVASTKAFYSQIIAGDILSLRFAQLLGTQTERAIIDEIRQIKRLPKLMEEILDKKEEISRSAERYALSKKHWAVVGSGPNKVASDEIRIKLSELCYKTISTDVVEDKKHIDLSSEPLIIVCAGGSNEVVLSDIVKDVAIFKAHRATPIIITSEDKQRFKDYAASIISIPQINERLAPILNTLVGHLFGYYAACFIDEEARFLSKAKTDITEQITNLAFQGLSIYEIIHKKDFHTFIERLYLEFQRRKEENRFSAAAEVSTISDLTLLLKYALGKLPLEDFKEDFKVELTSQTFLDLITQTLDKAINELSRPIDTIKHQAKTVTVGTSRRAEEIPGPIFSELRHLGIKIDDIQNRNITILKNIQRAILNITGYTMYKISNLDKQGMPKQDSHIRVLRKMGISRDIRSRTEEDNILKGTKRSVVRSGDVYVGIGKFDGRYIVIVPILSFMKVRFLLLFHIEFDEGLSLQDKILCLGDRYDDIIDDVEEHGIKWRDEYLSRFKTSELLTKSSEGIVNAIIEGGR